MKITSRDKKFLATGAVAVCIFIIMKFFALPFYDKVSEQRKDIELKERTLEKYLKFIRKQAELQQTLKHLTREETKTYGSLLQGETPSLAAADIQKIVNKIAENSELKIKSVKVMEPGQKEGFITIPIRVQFDSDLSRMKNFIHSIEANRKLLTIPDLKIRVKNKRKPKEISVTLQISGFMEKEETES